MGFCGNCGVPVDPEDLFCGACGTRLDAGSPEESQVANDENAPAEVGATEPSEAVSRSEKVLGEEGSGPGFVTDPSGKEVQQRQRHVFAIVAVALIAGMGLWFASQGTDQTIPEASGKKQATAVPAKPVVSTQKTTKLRKYPEGWTPVSYRFGRISDRSGTARLCAESGSCRPADRQSFQNGDRLEARGLTVVDLEKADGDISRHGIEGTVRDVGLVNSSVGLIALFDLLEGRMAGTVRSMHHVVTLGTGVCSVYKGDYVAERSGGKSRFVMETGTARCQANGRQVELTPSKRSVEW